MIDRRRFTSREGTSSHISTKKPTYKSVLERPRVTDLVRKCACPTIADQIGKLVRDEVVTYFYILLYIALSSGQIFFNK
ncbi:unnamed protein product, partial [Ilex paraguariensis]